MKFRGRILALDWGAKRIGLALCDELHLSVRGLPTIRRTNRKADLERLHEIVSVNDVALLLVGVPMRLSGERSRSVSRAEQFGRTLAKRTGRPLELWDEKLTSVAAEDILRDRDPRYEKADVDRAAAELILTSYLESQPRLPPAGGRELDL